ncbi:unnamed protein product, partial [marine sediment metagenome]
SADEEDVYDELSKSDKDALDFAVEHFGSFDQFQLAEITHDYPEWKKFEKVSSNPSLSSRRRGNSLAASLFLRNVA